MKKEGKSESSLLQAGKKIEELHVRRVPTGRVPRGGGKDQRSPA